MAKGKAGMGKGMAKGMPPRGMPMKDAGKHPMPGGMMMKDSEMKAMMGGTGAVKGKKKAK